MAGNANDAHKTGTEVHGGAEHGSAFPPFDSTYFSSQLIWLTLIFGALYLLMSRVALPRVAGILKARGDTISNDLQTAKTAQGKAEAAGADLEKTLAEAKGKAQAMGQEAHQNLAAETEAKRKTLEGELNAKLAAADAQIAETKAKAMANVEAVAKDAAAAIVEHITGKPADAAKIAAALTNAKA
ncbi:MAG: F0F1 ATP synthase subunit B' [Rhodoblastus sp.]